MHLGLVNFSHHFLQQVLIILITTLSSRQLQDFLHQVDFRLQISPLQVKLLALTNQFLKFLHAYIVVRLQHLLTVLLHFVDVGRLQAC